MKIRAMTAAVLAAAIAIPVSLPAHAIENYDTRVSRIRTHSYTVTDATMVQMAEAELARLTVRQRSYYDVDFDGRISVADATIIQMHCANIIDLHSDGYLLRFKPQEPVSPTESSSAPTYEPEETEPAETDPPITIPFETTEPSEATEPSTQEKIEITEPTEATSAPGTIPTQPATLPTQAPTESSSAPTYTPGQPTYLRLDYSALKMGVNESFTFTVDTDAPSYTFRGFNDEVLTVDQNGTVTPHAPGLATVVCMTENGISAVCQFTICPEATKLSLNYGEKMKLGVGETIDFDSYVGSGTAACWRYYSSDNENVVKVERFGGLATAVGEGKANVLCTLENGVQAKCEITVEKLAQSLELNASEVTLAAGDKYDFDSYTKDGYAYFRNYHSLDEEIASFAANDGVVTAHKPGKTQIYCELINGVRAYAELTVVETPASIEVELPSDKIQVGEIMRVRVKSGDSVINNRFVTVSSSDGIVEVADSGDDYIDLRGMKLGLTDVTFTTATGLSQTVRLLAEGSKALCIDVSTWQGSYIDFEKVKSYGIDYVILRAGYGNEASQIDNQFINNYNKAKRAGLKVGVYWFSYATDELDALNEAAACLECLDGRELDMPVYYDIEYEKALNTMSYDELTRMALFFCNEITKAGYRPGVYTSVTVYQNQIDYYRLIENGISIWNAHWAPRCTISCDIWQYSEEGWVWGIDGDVDMNLIYNLYIVE